MHILILETVFIDTSRYNVISKTVIKQVHVLSKYLNKVVKSYSDGNLIFLYWLSGLQCCSFSQSFKYIGGKRYLKFKIIKKTCGYRTGVAFFRWTHSQQVYKCIIVYYTHEHTSTLQHKVSVSLKASIKFIYVTSDTSA